MQHPQIHTKRRWICRLWRMRREKKPVEISKSAAGTSTVVSNKPIVSKTTEGYQTIYRSTSETIMPFIPVICLYFGDGICPKAYGKNVLNE